MGGWGRREPDSDLGPGNGKNHKEQKYKDKNVVYIGTNIDRERLRKRVWGQYWHKSQQTGVF